MREIRLTTSFTLLHTGLFQCKCACGGTPGLEGEYDECRRSRMNQYRSANSLTEPRERLKVILESIGSTSNVWN